MRPWWLAGSGLIQRRSNSISKTTVLAKQGSVGHDAACRPPGNNNVGFGGKYRVKKDIKIALATLSRGAGNEAEERSQKILMCLLVHMVRESRHPTLGKGESILPGNFL